MEIHQISISLGDARVIALANKDHETKNNTLILIDARDNNEDLHMIEVHCGLQFPGNKLNYLFLLNT